MLVARPCSTGVGLFAETALSPGHVVVDEEPLLIAGAEALSWEAFAALTDDALEQLMALEGGDTLLDKARCNGVALGDGRGGVFAAFSRLNHSCVPNCSFLFREGRMRVTTVQHVAQDQEVTISYRPNDLAKEGGRVARRAQLLRRFAFLCRCAECAREEQEEEQRE